MVRAASLLFVFGNLGGGQVVRDTQPENLIEAGRARYAPSLTPNAPNLRLLSGVASPRDGYRAHHAVIDTDVVNGLFYGLFPNGSAEVLRATKNDVFRSTGSAWSSISGAYNPTGAVTNPWAFGMVRRVGAPAGRQIFLCNGVDPVYRWYAGGTDLATTGTVGAAIFTGARVLMGHRGRSLIANVIDSGGARRNQRVHFSIQNDPDTHTGYGSGYVDLDEDPYPNVAGAVFGGSVCIYKGNNVGGAVVVGTPTGIANSPYRWDTVSASTTGGEVGILLPRSLCFVTPGVAFFVAHDGFRLHDGARGSKEVASTVTRDILSRVNSNRLDMGFAYYNPRTYEVVVGIPTGTSDYPSEFWVYNVREDRVYGPWTYADILTAASPMARTSTLTWGTTLGTWGSNPYAAPNNTWGTLGGAAGGVTLLVGTSAGATYEATGSDTTDNQAAIAGTWYSPAMRPEGQVVSVNGSQRALQATDTLVLRRVILTFQDRGEWLPTVSVSTDGGSVWTVISNSDNVGGIGGRRSVQYTCTIPGNWHQVRVQTPAAPYPGVLAEVACELTYGGTSIHVS